MNNANELAVASSPQEARKYRQFELERKLAERLRAATREERQSLYTAAYRELYLQFPGLQLNEDSRSESTKKQMSFFRRFVFPSATVVEVGAGRCHLARAIARDVRHMVTLDVASLETDADGPKNMCHIVFDGFNIPLRTAAADVVVSNQVIEHLRRDDALEQLAEVRRILRPGGTVALITPNRVTGPHDISRDFAQTAEGLHLHEYQTADLVELLQSCGFCDVRVYLGFKGKYMSVPLSIAIMAEQTLRWLPPSVRTMKMLRWLAGIRVSATK